jgi:hypothetical protein
MWLGSYMGGSKDLKKNKSEKGYTMILENLTDVPSTDPSNLLRLRDRVYSADLFIKSGHKLTTPPRSKR